MTSPKVSFQTRVKRNLFPPIYETENFIENKSLKPIKFLSHIAGSIISSGKIKIPFEVKIPTSGIDIFLKLDGIKSDMYYSVPSGKYVFHAYPPIGKSTIEIYYILNGFKSPSVYSAIKKI